LIRFRPFRHQFFRPGWQIALKHLQSVDIKDANVFAINGMEMRRRMISKEQLDNDSVESSDLRHIPILSSRLLLPDRILGLSGYRSKGFRLFYCHVGEYLAVKLDPGKAQAVNELRIFHVVQAARRVDADDPQLSKIAFFQFAAGVGKIQPAFDRFLGRALQFRFRSTIAFG
jgi:hypothetical protein